MNTNEKHAVGSDFYTRIKDVFIELHQYSFFHSHSDNDNRDRRFIGRKAVKEKLTNILTKSETKSGAYLVTGFRGMGKTSMVNTVLDDIVEVSFQFPPVTRILRIATVLFLLCLINQHGIMFWGKVPFSCFIASIVSIFIVLYFSTSPEHDTLRLYEKRGKGKLLKWMGEVLIIFPKIFEIADGQTRTRTSRTILQDSIMIGLVYLLTLCHFRWSNHSLLTVNDKVGVSLMIFFGIILSEWILKKWSEKWKKSLNVQVDNSEIKPNLNPEPEILAWLTYIVPCFFYIDYFLIITFTCSWYTWVSVCILLLVPRIFAVFWDADKRKHWFSFKDFIEPVTNHINFGHIVQVKVNLGHDDLREIDVLRLIAKATHQRYRSWYLSWLPLKKLVWRLFFFFLLVLGVSLFYFYQPIYKTFKAICYENGYMNFFPSQALLLVDTLHVNDGPDVNVILWQGVSSLENRLEKDDFAWDASRYIFHVNEVLQEKRGSLIKIGIKGWPNNPNFLDSSMHRVNWWGRLRELTVVTDLFIFSNYQRTFGHALHGNPLPSVKDPFDPTVRITPDFPQIPPPVIDYWFVIWFFTALLLSRFMLSRSIYVGLRTHRYVLRLLENLVDNIDANVTNEQIGNVSLPAYRTPLFSFRRAKQAPMLEAKAIENQLVHILNEAEKIPGITIRPRFVYIFDELDKIEPNFQVSAREKEDENVKLEGTRMRQEVIAKILANLKHFFNEAKAKFIFIAGREMYDAALADISDREASISSIFSDIIYVDSFFTDDSDGRATDITSMTEWYVCQFLFPEEHRNRYPQSLKGYNRFLQDRYFIQQNKRFTADRRQKIILTLHYFITYLAYRSNGAPKKITTLFEDAIVQPDESTLCDPNNLVVGQSFRNLYLHFDYDAQYLIGFTSYLHTPFLMSISPYIHEMGDKLLVSTSFILDHLYKFHPYGFSWRNLELTPEIVAYNKDPHLRQFITELVSFLSQVHLRHIPSGLHEFRFNRKIHAEIHFISQISEAESAAYNFTLDESLQLKRYYKKKLGELKKTYAGRETQFTHSIAYVQMVLGDLCFFDQEYDEALLYYFDAVQILRTVPPNEMLPNQFVLFVRNMLKLGLVNERKKLYEPAFMVYSQVSSLVVGVREIDLEKLGLQESILKYEELPEFIGRFFRQLEENGYRYEQPQEKDAMRDRLAAEWKDFFKTHPVKKDQYDQFLNIGTYIVNKYFISKGKNIPNATTRVVGRKMQASTHKIRKQTATDNQTEREEHITQMAGSMQDVGVFYGFAKDFFERVFPSLRFSPEKERNILKFSMQEGFRLMYQPILARLQVAEKGNLGGVTLIDILRAEEEFEYLTLPVQSDQKFMAQGEFYNKLGDLLFYKNGFLFGEKVADGNSEETYAQYKLRMLDVKFNSDTDKAHKKHYKAPLAAYDYYMRCLHLLVKRMIEYELDETVGNPDVSSQHYEKKCICAVFLFLNSPSMLDEKFPGRSDIFFETLGNAITDVADCLLSMAPWQENPIRTDFFIKVLYTEEKDFVEILSEKFKFEDLEILEQAFLYYYCASKVFRKNSNFTKSNSQLLKLLHLLNEMISVSRQSSFLSAAVLEAINASIVNIYLRDALRAYEHSNRPELIKLRGIFGEQMEYLSANESRSAYILNSASVSTDIREIILLFSSLSLRSGCPDKNICDLKQSLTSPYSVVNKRYVRVWELNYRCHLNYKILADWPNMKSSPSEQPASFLSLFKTENDPERKEELADWFNKNFPKSNILLQDKLNSLPESEKTRLWWEHFGIFWTEPENTLPTDLTEQEATCAMVEFLITDSIYCLLENIKSHKIFGMNYVASGHSILANAHEKMAFWCEFLLLYQYYLTNNAQGRYSNINKKIQKLTGSKDQYLLSPWYHFEMAISSYNSSLELHNEGKAYREMLEGLYYLDDDFNDDILHFSMALERYKINTGMVEKQIKYLEKKLKGHRVYDWSEYIKKNV